MHTEQLPARFAAPAPSAARDEDDGAGLELGANEVQRSLHEFCEDWAYWCHTRRYFVPPSNTPSLLGRLTSKSRPVRAGGPDAACSPELAAFHLAVLGQPRDALDRKVFELHYIVRVRNIKSAAAALGIGRQHWYTLIGDFRSRVFDASLDILSTNKAAAEALPHRSTYA